MVPTGFGEMLTISGEAGEPNHKILDIFHAREHLWSYARSYFDTEIAAKAWAEPSNDRNRRAETGSRRHG